MLSSGYRCPRCNTLLESRAVLSYSSTTCACQTGDCTCGYDTEMVCPECSGLPAREIKLRCYSASKQKIEKHLKELISSAPWLGDKKARQRDHNKNKQKQQFSKSYSRLHHQKRSRRK